MSYEKYGGPAFPLTTHFVNSIGPATVIEPGMTLRDYFAAKAMAVALNDCLNSHTTREEIDDHLNSIAKSAYAVADAMLAERQPKGEITNAQHD